MREKQEDKQPDKQADRAVVTEECKRPFNSLTYDGNNKEPTEEEMELFQRKRRRIEDPMANYI